MKRIIKATTGRSTSPEYIKSQLFDYMADSYYELAGMQLSDVADAIEALSPYYDIDDILTYVYEEGESIPEAIDYFTNKLYEDDEADEAEEYEED